MYKRQGHARQHPRGRTARGGPVRPVSYTHLGILNYLKDISQYTSEKQEENAFLKREMDKLTFVHPESVLGSYLNRQPIRERTLELDGIIFPFRFNLSQKKALENALKMCIRDRYR